LLISYSERSVKRDDLFLLQFYLAILCTIIKDQKYQKGLELNETKLFFYNGGVSLLSINVNTTDKNENFILLKPIGYAMHHQFNIKEL